ncbi:UvrD-helicase domain-containing protein [Micromonospora inositola]|uniref:UvrD-helicase domain-containing protein n=1 Tax=Micromonospora inositola TaxID=47865 RepID=UPI00155F6772|nr:UvrD-helicase domain-containing protein [Micromonospora inositola]
MSAGRAGEDQATTEQRQVVDQPWDARTLVIAPAGTGKTFTLVQRLDRLSALGLDADEVLVLSFSRAAVQELERRSSRSTGAGRFVKPRTFDAWALELLTQTYAGEWQLLGFDERIRTATEAILAGDAEEFLDGLRHVMLDEVQDLVGDRRRLVQALLEALDTGFTAVGDPAQAVYDFQSRGGRDTGDVFSWLRGRYRDDLVELSLTRDFRAVTPRPAGLLACGEALRSQTGIVDPRQIASSMRRELLDVQTAGALQDIVTGFSYLDGDCAVLCRDNGQALEVSAVLHAAGVAHQLQRRSGDDLNPRWLLELFGSGSALSVTHDEFLAACGLDADTAESAWQALRALGRGRDRIDLARLRALIAARGIGRLRLPAPAVAVTVSSLHRAKGLEFDRVFLLDSDPRDDEDPLEQARLTYMAMTRSRRELFRLEALPARGRVYRRKSAESGRWGLAMHGRTVSRRPFLGMAVEGQDVDHEFPAGVRGFSDDPAALQRYLADVVRPGDEVRMAVLARDVDDCPVPLYGAEHRGRFIAVMSRAFREAMGRHLGGRTAGDRRSWPATITDCRVEAVEVAAGSTAAGARAGLGEHGVWLAPRISGLSRFHYEKAEG